MMATGRKNVLLLHPNALTLQSDFQVERNGYGQPNLAARRFRLELFASLLLGFV